MGTGGGMGGYGCTPVRVAGRPLLPVGACREVSRPGVQEGVQAGGQVVRWPGDQVTQVTHQLTN